MFDKLKKAAAPIYLPSVARALRSPALGPGAKDALWRFAQRYGTFFNVSAEAVLPNGCRMTVSSGPRVEQEIFLFGEWEPLFTRYMLSRQTNNGIFVDVGANIGYFTVLASSFFAEVHAIEASPATARRLKANVAANDLRNVIVHEVAVGAERGVVDFYQSTVQSGAASVLRRDDSVFEAQVPMAPLPDILADVDWQRVKFVKIDVEGFEAPVLESLATLSDRLPDDVEIFVEYDPQRLDSWPAIEILLEKGFEAAIMQGPYDRADYVDHTRCSPLTRMNSQPSVFCDLLLRRSQ